MKKEKYRKERRQQQRPPAVYAAGLRKDSTLVLEQSSLVHGSSPEPPGPNTLTSSLAM
jgi:hypothetical protein